MRWWGNIHPRNPAKQVAEAKGYTAMLGHYHLRGEEMDETIALFFRAPHSYTGEDVIELSVHGGNAMAQGLLEALYLAGAAPAGPGEFTRRALENGRMSLTQAEAVMEIISAEGRQGAALAKSALDGALARRIAGIQAALQTLAAHLTAWIEATRGGCAGGIAGRADRHTERAEGHAGPADCRVRGRSGFAPRGGLCAAGPPQCGQEPLLNLLAGFDRAIVLPIAGTTRDVLEQAVMLGDTGIRLNLFDTAGVRDVGEHGDAVEAEGDPPQLEKAGGSRAGAGRVRPGRPAEWGEPGNCTPLPGPPCAGHPEQQDLAGQGEAFTAAQQQLAPYFKAIIPLTARDAASLQPLCQAVAQLLGTANLDPNAAALCSARQLSAAKEACDALAEALNSQEDGFRSDAAGVCISDAQRALAGLTGEDATEATIDEVFSTFLCGQITHLFFCVSRAPVYPLFSAGAGALYCVPGAAVIQ